MHRRPNANELVRLDTSGGRMKGPSHTRIAALAAVVLISISLAWVGAQQTAPPVAIDPDDIGGVVTSAKGPEAGVWVIAETTELPTKFARIVVTDDQGRYVLPDLPRARYQVFVRGYGLVDSARVPANPGQHLDLKATDFRERLRITSCCLTSTDSATTERAPPGPASRATVASRCRKRTARSRTTQSILTSKFATRPKN